MTGLPLRMRRKIVFELTEFGMCWSWTGCLNSKGYGCAQHEGKVQLTHRISYEVHNGPIPTGLQIDHLCRNKRCCNPTHLEAVTGKVNCERTPEATKTRCKNDHPLAGPNVRLKSKPGGGRQRECVVCAMDYARNQKDMARKGVRKPSPNWEMRRTARREWLITQGEAALLGLSESVAS